MLFLVSSPRVVSLDVAAKILIGEDQGACQDKNKFKSESRTVLYRMTRSIKGGFCRLMIYFLLSQNMSSE